MFAHPPPPDSVIPDSVLGFGGPVSFACQAQAFLNEATTHHPTPGLGGCFQQAEVEGIFQPWVFLGS